MNYAVFFFVSRSYCRSLPQFSEFTAGSADFSENLALPPDFKGTENKIKASIAMITECWKISQKKEEIMFKKIICTSLIALLVMTMTPAVSAAEPLTPPTGTTKEAVVTSSSEAVKERLGKVTLLVKQNLNLDDRYTTFNGTLNEDIIDSYWNLNWSNDQETLTVYAKESGKVMQYQRYRTADNQAYYYKYNPDFSPVFPANSRIDAKLAAETFVPALLTTGETAVFEPTEALELLSATTYGFSGKIQMHGLDTGITFSVTVFADDLTINRFSRSDANTKIINNFSDTTTAVDAAAAAAKLRSIVKMQLQYVLKDTTPSEPVLPQPEGIKTTGNTSAAQAVLRYLPMIDGNYIVDAKTGELIDITDLYDAFNRANEAVKAPAGMGSSDSSSYGSTLSEVELAGVEKLKDVLSKEELQAAVKNLPEVMLDDSYTLTGYNFYLNEENGDVTVYLNFSKTYSENDYQFYRKFAVLNGKTGALLSLSSSYPYDEKAAFPTFLTEEQATEKAAAFLNHYYAVHFAATELYASTAPVKTEHTATQYQFTYSQKVNGYFFPTNSISISINAQSGAVDSFNQNWTENIVFDQADGIIPMTQAEEIYTAAHTTKLQYLQLPVTVDPESPYYILYSRYGYAYLYEYRLAYQYSIANAVYGIDAKTGELLQNTPTAAYTVPVYTDLDTHYAKIEIETLAQYGIGFNGNQFQPESELTQREMLVFLLQAAGYLNPMDDDSLYNTAYSLHLLTEAERAPASIVSRVQFVKTLLSMSGYNKIAHLSTIFVCRFQDEAAIASENYGYIAIAQGLGIVHGDPNGNFRPDSATTRAAAAVMLFNFLNREN